MTVSPKKLKLFVVDDDEDVLRMHAALLERAGHEAIVNVDAAAAIPAMRRSQPDAVLVDVVMGGLDGLEFCRALRQYPELERTTILALTNLSSAEYWRERLMSVGANGLVSKPLTEAKVREIERLVAATSAVFVRH